MKSVRLMQPIRVVVRWAIILYPLSLSSVQAEVKLPAIFGDHMILQQEARVPVWGTADAGEKITVTVGDHNSSTTAGADGKWQVDLAPFPNGMAATTMIVAGKNTLTFQDVLIGDVWVCSGQSNMEFAMVSASNAKDEIPQANDTQLRFFKVAPKLSMQPLTELGGTWQLCTPDTVKDFSAVGYFFGRELRNRLKRPIGLIGTYWGGSTAQAWTSLSGLQKDPPFTRYLDIYKSNLDAFAQDSDHYDEKEAAWKVAYQKWKDGGNQDLANAWVKTVIKAREAHQPEPPVDFATTPQEPPMPGGDQKAPANLYNGMISPLLPYAIKGVAWYQGEYNSDDPMEYYDLLPRLIADWREKWGQGAFPFLVVQLPALFVIGDADFPRKITSDSWDIIREVQMQALTLPNTGLAVTLDLGGELHPPDKIDVGRRLALVARHKVYGENIVDSGPMFQSVKKDGTQMVISFTQVNGGLTIGTSPFPDPKGSHVLQPTGKLAGFIIAGADKNWVEADAEIKGDTVVVSSPRVQDPASVRYGWGSGIYDAECNLYNKDGLPAAPFRTDDWIDVIPANAKFAPARLPKSASSAPATVAW
jgi:sialate O-acetylesterase